MPTLDPTGESSPSTGEIGDLDPIDEVSGARQRLEHLGYRKSSDGIPETDAEATVEDKAAMGLPATGALDDATTAAIVKAHGS